MNTKKTRRIYAIKTHPYSFFILLRGGQKKLLAFFLLSKIFCNFVILLLVITFNLILKS